MTPKPLTLSERVALNLMVKRAKAAEASHRTKRRRERRKKAKAYARAWDSQKEAQS